MEVKKYLLIEDIPNPSLQKINPNYRINFVGLDFNKVSNIRFMKEVKRIGNSLEIPIMYERFQVYGFNELPEEQNNYVTYEELWGLINKDLVATKIISPIIKLN